jgi:HKD family nuclease
MKLIQNPWKNDFLELVEKAEKSIKITSPFIKENICKELLNVKNKNTSLNIITSFKLMNVHSGSLDISALEKIIESKGVVKNFNKLHSKIYLFDDNQAVITSGNLTNGGLINNHEYGILLSEKTIVNQVVKDFDNLFTHENTGKITEKELKTAKAILSNLPDLEQTKISNFKLDNSDENIDIIEIDPNFISTSLKGWKLEVFKCANAIPQQEFNLIEIYQSLDYLKLVYPNNNTIHQKIRQQLQFLRNLGLIDFLGNGKYKKLWK